MDLKFKELTSIEKAGLCCFGIIYTDIKSVKSAETKGINL